MERKLTKVVDGTEITVGGKMCSCGTDMANDLCSWECPEHMWRRLYCFPTKSQTDIST